MTANTNRQYRPVSDRETGTNDGLSVRAINDLADSINNYTFRAGVGKLVTEAHYTGLWQSSDPAVSTDENIWGYWAKRYLADGPNYFACHVNGKRTAGAGTIVIKIYCSEYNYVGDQTIDLTGLSPGYTVSTVGTINAGAPAVYKSRDLAIPPWSGPAAAKDCYFLMTLEPSNATTRATITNVDIAPIYIP